MVSLCGRGFESHQVHPTRKEKAVMDNSIAAFCVPSLLCANTKITELKSALSSYATKLVGWFK